MSQPDKKIGYLYINGLGEGLLSFKDRLVRWWWGKRNAVIQHAQVNWYDGETFDVKLSNITTRVDGMLQTFSGVVIIGSSAGGSLAVNAFSKLKSKNVCVVIAHGRVKSGDYPEKHRMSLHHRAHLDTSKPSQSFFESVIQAEDRVIPSLSEKDKQRLLILTQITDMVVPIRCMIIEGVQVHRSLAFGHSGGFVAHLFADRNLIIRFAESQLSDGSV